MTEFTQKLAAVQKVGYRFIYLKIIWLYIRMQVSDAKVPLAAPI